ncbi:MAG: DNA translocase FtsK [Acidobacteria bacterium]|nr:DNA translocase FtsK [Acidobacteriota bacterium]
MTSGDNLAAVDLNEDDGLTAHRKSVRRKKAPVQEQAPSAGRDAFGWTSVVVAVALALALMSYDPTDPSFFTETSKHRADNLLGPVGAHLAAVLMQFLGLASYFFPILAAYLGIQAIRGKAFSDYFVKLLAGSTIWVALVVFAGGMSPFVVKDIPIHPGGTVGIDLYRFMTLYLNTVGTVIVLLGLIGLALLMATQLTLADIGNWMLNRLMAFGRSGGSLFLGLGQWLERRRKNRMRDSIIIRELEKMDQPPAESKETSSTNVKEPPPRRTVSVKPDPVPVADSPQLQPVLQSKTPSSPADVPVKERKRKETGQETFEFMDHMGGKWVYPSSHFFQAPKPEHKIDEQELKRKAKLLQEKFEEFGVTGNMEAIHPGPVVTTYEFRPDAGIKYSRIVNLQDDLCLALGAESIRIDRMPGRSSIGMEVPNSKREIITFREMIESKLFCDDRSKLLVAMGKTIEGDPYYSNLAKMPHLLIAGQTGSGKSVGINAMICSILMRAAPHEAKFILIDPKMVEMGIYADIPHLLTPVVTDPQEASNALKWAVAEMEDRYRTLASHNFRNLEQFNASVIQGKVQAEEGEDPLEPMPNIVVVIDELADLMMVARGEVEESIARIAQKSRAVGIHMILATQRPSVDIITGVIKSNLPSRLSYRVAQKNDSRIILDGNGAEKLLGRGDSLFLAPGTARLVRIHAPLLMESEILQMVKFLRQQGQPDYNHTVLKSEADDVMVGGISSSDDPMYDQAARLVVRSGQASVSYIQRKMRLGYNRAARLVDMMEADGIVGPNVGSKARDILVPADYFDEINR